MWLRLSAATPEGIPAIQVADYLDLSTDGHQFNGIVMRMHTNPWRIDVLCHIVSVDDSISTSISLLPAQTRTQAKVQVWPVPLIIKPTIILADDNNGLAAISQFYAWKAMLPQCLLLWQTRNNLPFPLSPSHIYTSELPPNMIATMQDFEHLGVVLRLLSDEEKPGCFHGDIAALFKQCPVLTSWHMIKIRGHE